MTAPPFRQVSHKGEIASAPEGLTIPAPLPAVAEVQQLREDLHKAITARDDAKAELDNMVDLTVQVGRLGTYLKHAIADRDDYREQCDEWREKYEAAQCRMDELAGDLAAARAERDTARAVGSVR